MKTKLFRNWAVSAAVMMVGLMQAAQAMAQTGQLESAVPRIPVDNQPSLAVPWGIAFLFTVLILLAAFRNSKRTHMD